MWGWLFLFAASAAVVSRTSSAGAGAARLVCYASGRGQGFSECTHLVYTGDARGDKLEGVLKEYKKDSPRIKILLRIGEFDKDLRALLKSKHIQGLEVHDAHKTLNRTKVLEVVDSARSAISAAGGGPLFLSLPAHPELLAKYYDLQTLVKKADLMMLQTHHLGHAKNTTYHPSRLSGLWDMLNTDSVVDLAIGLGVPASKIVISLPATARQFHLLNETLSTPGSPTTEEQPKEIDQAELCRQLQKGRWTLERDQDLSAPYAFQGKTWISFEDPSSIDVKGKYARVRGLAGLALHQADRDAETPCAPPLRTALAKVLNQQSRAPRAAVLRSLENEILSAPRHERALDALQVSPYRITQVVDSDGVIHSIREDTRTEFSCSRQGYFVHPRSCARFYRCVKFDQYSPEFTVFEFDCPAGLAFDARHEVCVWPGSLPHSQACPGSSEIAPVPKARFQCPQHEGYYADPENCRWFFACLDHGDGSLTAYEFRCPFGLGFDAARLTCDWPWLVPACGNIARYEAEAFGFSSAALTSAAGFHGQTADAINVAAHNSLVSGAALSNLVGIQSLNKYDALDDNYIASQQLAGVNSDQGPHQLGEADTGFVNPTKYTSGSIILDDYRLPTKEEALRRSNLANHGQNLHLTGSGQGQINVNQENLHLAGLGHQGISGLGYNQGLNHGQNLHLTGQESQINFNRGISGLNQGVNQGYSSQKSQYNDDSGKYVHDPTGDRAEPYKHIDGPVVPYVHDDSKYKHTADYYDVGRYSGNHDISGYSGNHDTSGYSGKYDTSGYAGKYDTSGYAGKYDTSGHAGQYDTSGYAGKYDTSGYSGNHDTSGYSGKDTSGYSGKYDTGSYSGSNDNGQYVHDNSGNYQGDSNSYKDDNFGSYKGDNSGSYIHDNSGQYIAGVYRSDGHIGNSGNPQNYQGSYSSGNAGNYLTDTKAYTGASHTLTAGAINVGLVGKTTLVDAQYQDQGNYQQEYNNAQSYIQNVVHNTLQNGHVPIISQPAVSINHVGTDGQNLDGYIDNYVTTPTSSGIPTTATPFVTTTVPITTTYKTTFVPEAPKSTIKEIFGYSAQPVTVVHPTIVPVKQYTPNVQVTNYNQGGDIQDAFRKTEGYDYSKPAVQFEEGITHTTQAPVVVSTFKPQGFSHTQQTLHNGYQYSTPVPVKEEPFIKKFAYTTGPEIQYAQPTFAPQAFLQETVHKVETNAYTPVNTVEYTTAQPTLSAPQGFNHQTLHKVDAGQVNTYDTGYKYEKPESGYNYDKPAVAFEIPQTVVSSTATPVSYNTQVSHQTYHEVKLPETVYSTPSPIVSTYKPQLYSQQTYHQVETQKVIPVTQAPVIYQPVSVYKNPILKYTEKVTPVSYAPQSFSQQTIHKVEANQVNLGSGYHYEAPKTVVQYETVTPASYVPSQSFSQQAIHKVEGNQVNLGFSGYHYEAPKTVIQYENVTPAPYVPSQSFSQQTIHKFEQNLANIATGYHYEAPKTVVQYEKPAQSFSQQTIHKVEGNQVDLGSTGYHYEAPKTVVQYEHVTPAPYVPSQSFSQQTVHNVQNQANLETTGYHYEAPKTVVQYEKPAHSFSQQTVHNVQNQANLETTGYHYEAPKTVVQYEKPAQSFSQQTVHNVQNQANLETTGYHYEAPKTVVQYEKPAQSFSQQTIHNVQNQANLETTGYHYESPKTIVQYEKPAQSFSQQTIHKVEANQVNLGSTGYHYEAPKTVIRYENVTPAPYAPSQSFSQQTIHKVENQANLASGYHYEAPTTVQYEKPAQSFSQQTIHKVEENVNLGSSGYSYEAPKTVVQYERPSETYSQQTLHKVEENQVNLGTTGYQYHYEAPKTVIQYEKPAQSFSQQTIHKVEANQELGQYQSVAYEAPKTVIQYTTPQPILEVRPQVFAQQTLHKVDASKVNNEQETGYKYEKSEGYSYEKPAVQFEQTKTVKYSTAAPQITTYRPQTYNLQTIHNIKSQEYLPASTPVAKVELYQQPAVTINENPIFKYTQNFTPKPTIVTENYQPIIEHTVSHIKYPAQYESSQQNLEISQGYSYSQPEIQRDAENHKAYSDATLVSNQVYHLYNTEAKNEEVKKVAFVSTTPANLVYEDHYSEYEQKKPIKQYQETYSVSTESAPVFKQNIYTKDKYDYKPVENIDTSSLQQISFSTSDEQPKQVESFHISSYPGTTITTKYNQESAEIQDGYKAEEYLPPVVSTQGPVTTYRPRTYSTVSSTREYLPPSPTPTYLPAEYSSPEYLPPSSTVRPRTKAPRIQSTTFKAPDYLPPDETNSGVQSFESFGYKNEDSVSYNPYQEQIVSTASPIERQRNIVVETSKSNLLGFGTVGPDAGLVSPISYTTSTPIVSSTYEPVSSTYSQELSSRAPATKLRPKYKSSTQAYVESTTFKAPEYLPPSDEQFNFDSYRLNGQSNSYVEEVSSTLAPRKQNIVVETAKANLLGFGTIGNDAGLVEVSSTSAPEYEISSTYGPIQEELVEVRKPLRRTKPKVAVVTKINDFNPLLVRKLGAVCSCQSPIVILRGRRPNNQQDNDYSEYEVVTRGDVSDEELAIKSARLQLAKARKQQVTSTFNPIIVPDDSYYQDYDESLDVTQNNFVSSTTPVYSTTEKIVRIRPRVKGVTVAPTYKSLLLDDLKESPIVVDDLQEASVVITERTGPRRDELSAAIDCQRAGLFRHPKQCNKFYSCRWDVTKQKFALHVFNCPIHLSFDSNLGACNWPSQGPACQGDTLLTNAL